MRAIYFLEFHSQERYGENVLNPATMASPLMRSLSRLDVIDKWLLLSASILGLSTLMPWYADIDAFGAGDTFLGVNGPLFLFGFFILASCLFMIGWIVAPIFGKRLPTLPIKEGTLFTFLSVQMLFLLFLANSVFFHPKFGVNITLKNTQFGMLIAVAAALILTWSSYRLYRRQFQKRTSSLTPESESTLITMPEPSIASPQYRERVSTLLRKTSLDKHHDSEEEPNKKPQPLRMDL